MGKDFYKILLVDDEKLILDSLEIILSLSEGESLKKNFQISLMRGGTLRIPQIIGKAEDGNAALKILERVDGGCDIALVDLNMKGMGGLELIKIIKEKYPRVKILVLTTFYDDKSITSAIAGGADGYLLKDSGKDVILGAIAQIMEGITVLDQKVMLKLAALIGGNLGEQPKSPQDSVEGEEEESGGGLEIPLQYKGEYMTEREKQICQLMVEGLTNRQIAERLYISEGTVKNYISNIYDKTGIHDRVKLIVELKK